jgi:uncharacterized protein (TIGR00369 family)
MVDRPSMNGLNKRYWQESMRRNHILAVTQYQQLESVLDVLGIEITEYTRERVVATMPVTSKTHQPLGILHGGVSVVLAETVASSGSYLFIDPEKQQAVGMEINANHIRVKRDGILKAVGVPVHVGRTSIIWDIRLYDEKEKLICISRCTMAIINSNTDALTKG